MKQIGTIMLLMIKMMKRVLMKVAVMKIVITVMMIINILKEMGTILLIQNDEDNGEDIYDDDDC
jgi:hypothetical protein